MARLYTYLALLLLNTVLLFAAVNIAAALYLDWRGPQPTRYASHWLIDSYGFDVLAKAYPGWNEDELRLLLTESSNWLLGYEPFTQFRPVARTDRYITIDPAGFRVSPPQGETPPADGRKALLVHRGSTALGGGGPDDSTNPARQERILFERLLSEGIVPDAALFLDGVTDFYFPDDTPQLTGRLADFVDGANRARVPERDADAGFATRMKALLEALPAWRLWRDAAPTLIGDASAAPF
ncbi:MAG: hypothetical protein VW618_05670, partial [Alphaproteobacteria bacterium]